MAKITPMMEQYIELKKQYNDSILFFRLGDFYEMFFEDALTASKELEITLTGRNCGLDEKAPMCGVPYHAAESYITKLISKGYKVAICEQVEDPALAIGIVKRDVVKVITPGTLIGSNILVENMNNYLMCIYGRGGLYGISVVDISTGYIKCTQIIWGNKESKLIDEIAKYSPSEIIINSKLTKNNANLIDIIKNRLNIFISVMDDEKFDFEICKNRYKEQFGETDLVLNFSDMYIYAVGGLLEYINQTQKANLAHVISIEKYDIEEYMILDAIARRNLELTETLRDRKKKGSLIWVLDKTKTSMGSRMLRNWIEQPLINVNDINYRLGGVEELKNEYLARQELIEYLDGIYDIERLLSKIVTKNANCRDMIAIKNSINKLPYIKEVIEKCTELVINHLNDDIDILSDVASLIEKAIIDQPPITIKDGGIIKKGYDEEHDKLLNASTQGKQWIASLQQEERERTGIKNLKIGYNKIFGYYIEVTKSYYSLIPENYIRKQTLANCERFVTQELKEMESTILGAEDKLISLEYDIFVDIRDYVSDQVVRIKKTARALSVIDVLVSLAEVADRNGYTRPNVTNENSTDITEGRHPVVELVLKDQMFVPNDTFTNNIDNKVTVITGPNMAGKSTYMRQVALMTIMAQIGSFVPAQQSSFGIVDRIFTRVGASDDLSSGQSTFMVEMNEVANILINATDKSLLILDEIGRGTSTYDGLSIAWSVIEFITDKIGCRTLFATHYHELTELEGKIDGLVNYCFSVDRKGNDITFIRKIEKGGADGSFGIDVARLAGVPESAVIRAREILQLLNEADISRKEKRIKAAKTIEGQIDLADYTNNNVLKEIEEDLKNLKLEELTPVDAINYLYKIQQKIRKC